MVRAFAEFAATQWRAGFRGRTGLDYGSVQAALQAHMPARWRRIFAGVRVIERTLLQVDAERRPQPDDDAH